MRLLTLILSSALAGCTVWPEPPIDCRAYGVDAEGEITGHIVSSEFRTLAGVEDVCGEGAAGCTIGVSGEFPDPDHAYRLYYAEHKCVPYHEACHALYEVGNEAHTNEFMLRVFRGDKLAACKWRDKYA